MELGVHGAAGSGQSIRIRGKELTPADIEGIQELVVSSGQRSRRLLSRLVCEHFGWRQPNGQVQDMACREILLRLERGGKITLPPRDGRGGGHPRKSLPQSLELPLEEPCAVMTGMLNGSSEVRLLDVKEREEHRRWNEQIARHHYLGYQTLVGRVLKYRIYWGASEVGLIGWSSP